MEETLAAFGLRRGTASRNPTRMIWAPMTNLKLALRTLAKTPFVTAVAILSLALGIGANSAIFSLFDQMVLRPLPVPEAKRLVNFASPGPKQGSTSCGSEGDCDEIFSYPMFRDLERDQEVLTGLAAHRSFGANLAFEGSTATGGGVLISGSYFPTLGVQPAAGRLLGPNDDPAIGGNAVVVLGHDYWNTRFAGQSDVVGKNLVVNGNPLEIIGVAPPGFRGTTLGNRPQVYVPITLRGLMSPGFDGFDDRQSYWVYLFGRLAPGVSLAEAHAALNAPYHAILNEVEAPLQEGMSDATMTKFRARTLDVAAGARGQSSLHEEAREPVLLLFAVAGVVLLIACANVANLQLARSAARTAEISIRLSVGASRRMLITQLLTESFVLATLGGLAGLFAAQWTLKLIGRLLPDDASATLYLHLEPSIILFACLLSIGTGFLFGLFPALHSSRGDLATVLKSQSGQPAGARSAARFRAALVTAQIALSLALLISAGLFAKSLVNVSKVDLGLSVENLVTFGISPELNGYEPAQALALFERTEEALAALPGVSAVTGSLVPLLAGSNWGNNVSVEGFESGPDTNTNSRFNEVGPGYFRALGMPLLAGREFTTEDTVERPKVAVINEVFANKFGLGIDAVGKRMATGSSDELDIEIIGLVSNAKYSDVKGETPPLYFRPYRQDDELGFINFYVRTTLPPQDIMKAIPLVVSALDPNLPIEDLKTMPQQIRENVYADHIISTLSSAFGGLATLLAAIGLYGVLAFTVAQRTREFGLRMALGARSSNVRSLVLRQVLIMTAVGSVVGIGVALALGRIASSQLFGLEPNDPLVMLAATLALGAVALLAGLLPALKASRIDPMVALRYDT